MELRQLRSFVKAGETMNFSEAAKELYVTQSTFSQSIKKLEEELKVQLFHRNSHEVVLTEAGMELMPFAQQILQQTDNCVNRIHDLMNLKHGTLNIGVTHSFSLVTSETIHKFVKDYPNIKLNIFYKTMNELMDMLAKREVDFVLSYKPSQVYNQIESHILFEDKLSVVVQKDHPLAKLKEVKMKELLKYPLALPAIGLQARNVFDKMLNNHRIEIPARIELNDVNALLGLVRSGSFITILSSASIDSQFDLKAIQLESDDCGMEGSFHILKDSYHKLSAKEFIRILTETPTIKKRMSKWF